MVEQARGPKSDLDVHSFGHLLMCIRCGRAAACGDALFADSDPSAFFRHLLRHAEAGHKVPKRLLRKVARRSLAMSRKEAA